MPYSGVWLGLWFFSSQVLQSYAWSRSTVTVSERPSTAAHHQFDSSTLSLSPPSSRTPAQDTWERIPLLSFPHCLPHCLPFSFSFFLLLSL
ncbi:hypothetical protein F5888DRAFT_1696302, partial [Russula emetica]